MAISLSGTRPAATLTQSLAIDLELKTPIENNSEGLFVPFCAR